MGHHVMKFVDLDVGYSFLLLRLYVEVVAVVMVGVVNGHCINRIIFEYINYFIHHYLLKKTIQ